LSALAAAAARDVLPVAVGVLVRADGAVLLADRPAGKPYAGFWEFPGGKVEPGESIEQALARELGEELGVRVADSYPWTVMEYDYPHAYVRLHFRRVFEWSGTPRPAEGQCLRYLQPGTEAPAPLLPAAVPALRWIQLPAASLASPASCMQAAQAIAWIDAALARGARQIVWHEPRLGTADLEEALRHAHAAARAYGVRLLLDSRDRQRLAVPPPQDDAGSCYLDAFALRAARVRPPGAWVGAGVRVPGDLDQAAALGCDFAILETAGERDGGSDAAWQCIAELGRAAPLPLFVPVPPGAASLRQARRLGAHGIALAGLD
jgi:8-oxo-dGTP diphosphatase